jgi:eukaryotic-like serine/threonine-protein kinase
VQRGLAVMRGRIVVPYGNKGAAVLGVETHTSLAVLWSGPGLARSVVIASSLGFAESHPWAADDTVISTDRPRAENAAAQDTWRCPSTPGQRLGRYRLIERLGRGCQGDVWRAIPDDPDAGGEAVEVALKLLPPSMARDPRRLAQFRREAERRARLAVPSVLPTSEYGEADGILFMAMPLVDGCSLAEMIAWRRRDREGLRPLIDPRYPLAEAPPATYLRGVVQIVAQVARTLDHVHTARVVHRDIKPANILLDRNRAEGVFLCDFGLGRDLDVATPEQLRDGAGTPLYMAPERLLRLCADEIRCDVYALGATLYEAVTLIPPVQVPESLPWPAWTSYLATTKPVPPCLVRSDIPHALEVIILRSMAHEPEERYPSAARLACDLESFLARVAEQDGKETLAGALDALSCTSLGSPARSTGLSSLDRAPAPSFASPWEWPTRDETSLAWISARLTCLSHPDIDAWKTPIAAE